MQRGRLDTYLGTVDIYFIFLSNSFLIHEVGKKKSFNSKNTVR